MGAIRIANPVKLFMGVLVSDAALIPPVETRLADIWGPMDHRSPVIPFTFTNYYQPEMGGKIDRVFFSVERLIEADRLPEIKRQTNEIQNELAPVLKTVKRPVNLDPGY